MYEVDHRNKNHRYRRRIVWLGGILAALVIIIGVAVIFALSNFKTSVTIQPSAPVVTKVTYDTKTKHFDESDFGIDMPLDWAAGPTAVAPNHPYRWQSKDGQVIQVFEDNIPPNFAVNRVLVVTPKISQLELTGSASDNCADFTKALPGSPGQAVPAKWQGIGFLCDETNQQPNVVGTSSTDGTNLVRLKQPSNGVMHSFFFTYTTHSTVPDYAPFYNALQSLRLK